MMTADEFVELFLEVLRRHTRQNWPSKTEAAGELGIARSTLYSFLNGTTNQGLLPSVQWAEKLGLSPEQWAALIGLAPGNYAAVLRRAADIKKQPDDYLLGGAARVARKLRFKLETPPKLPKVILTIDDIFHEDPVAADALARKELRNKLRQMRAYQRAHEKPAVEDIVEFFCLVGTYSTHRYSKTDPRTSAWGLALALDGLHRGGESPATTWLLNDGFRRDFGSRCSPARR